MLDNSSTMKHVWEAFSTLSDAQELILMNDSQRAIETINFNGVIPNCENAQI